MSDSPRTSADELATRYNAERIVLDVQAVSQTLATAMRRGRERVGSDLHCLSIAFVSQPAIHGT